MNLYYHWLECVCAVLSSSPITYRAIEQILSQRIGFRLYGIALEPILQKQNKQTKKMKWRKWSSLIHL